MGAAMQKLNAPASPDYEYDITPRRDCTALRHILSEDPRSPANNFARTPIVVDKISDNELDPRSPTPGIQRTPLAFLLYKGNITPEGSPAEPIETICEAVPEKSSCDKPKTALKETLNTGQMGATASDNLPQLESMSLVKMLHTFASDTSYYKGKMESIHSNKTLPNRSLPYPKQLFSSQQQVSQRKELSNTRSPLSPVVMDTNSPRIILQKRQRRRLARSAQQVIDKENCEW